MRILSNTKEVVLFETTIVKTNTTNFIVKAFSIKYDTDGKRLALQREFYLPIEVNGLVNFMDSDDCYGVNQYIDDNGADWISDITDQCVIGYYFKIITSSDVLYSSAMKIASKNKTINVTKEEIDIYNQ